MVAFGTCRRSTVLVSLIRHWNQENHATLSVTELIIEQSGRLLLIPFTLESSSRSIICYFHTFGNNLGIKRKFAKYFKESCCLSSDQHFSFKCFEKNAFVRKIFSKSSGLFWPL